jgi:hypothetical protein
MVSVLGFFGDEIPVKSGNCISSDWKIFIIIINNIIIIIIIIISCHRFSFFPGTSPLEPGVNPTTQASSLSL